MSSCAQGVRGVDCSNVGFYSLRLPSLSSRSIVPHSLWHRVSRDVLGKAFLFTLLLFVAVPAHAVKCIQAGYVPSEGAVDCKASTIIDDKYIGIVGLSSPNYLVGPTPSVSQAEADGIAFAENRYSCYVGTEVTQDWTPLPWGDTGFDANGRERSFRPWYKSYRSTYRTYNPAASNVCGTTTYTWDWGLRRDQWATCPGKYYDWFRSSEGGDDTIVCWNTKPVYESCNNLVANPISVASGSKIQHEDHIVSNLLLLSWHYKSSRNLIEGSVPAASASSIDTLAFDDRVWRHNFDKALKFSTTGLRPVVRLIRPDRIQDVYFIQVNGQWQRTTADHDKLTEFPGSSNRWLYHTDDDSIETYSATGKLLTIADRAGRVQTLVYDLPVASGGDDDPSTLDTVTDGTGRQLRFTYDANKRISTVTDPAGGVITYGYDTQNNLVSVQYPDGRSKTYLYENTSFPHALTGIVDENGNRYATYRYDSQGRADDEDHGGPVDHFNLAYTTDANGSPVNTVVTDPLGTQRTHNFQTILGVVKSTGVSQPGGSGCSAASSAITYDANGNIASRADFNGHKTCYAYDLTRNLETARVEGLASSASCPSDPATYTPAPNTAERKILTQWDTRFRLPTKVTEAGRETTTVYDSHGNVTSRSIKDLASGQTRTWSTVYAYHPTVPGVLMQKIDNGPRLDVADMTTTDYYAPDENCVGDPLGCRGQVKQITNALGHVTTYNEYDANGRVLRTTDPNGLVTTFSYSPRGWLTSRSVGSETTSFDYDYVGQLTKFTRPDGSYVSFEYDPAHRLTAIVQQDGGRLTYTLDAMGNRIQEEITGLGGHYIQRHTFDALGRLWKDIGVYNDTITYSYDAKGNLTGVDGARTDVADVTSHSYDTLDRLTQTLNADGGIVQVKTNALDQTTQVVDPVNQATTQTVDAFGDVTRTVSADTGTTNRTYDEAGNLKTETDARNVTVSYTYDDLNRLTQKQSNQSGSPVYQYFYDDCGAGYLCWTWRNSTLNNYFNYDAMGRLSYRLDFGGVGAYSDYAYHPGGQLATLTYPTGRSVTYSYDAQGRISQVATQPASGSPVSVLASNITYYPYGPIRSFTYGNNQYFQLGLNLAYRIDSLFDGPVFNGHDWNPDGTLSRLGTRRGTQTFSIPYTYDATGRLVSALDSGAGGYGSLTWAYDKNGNRQSETRNAGTMPYAYSPPNWLYQKGSETRPRTANGNTQSTSNASFTYDGFNRLATSQTASE
ncbi:MAG: RHS repeat protein, partial [Thiobacillus sp.]|nr:RHS repeat protein [Thiobacillus sp.]